jgi:cytochrome c peroxidase
MNPTLSVFAPMLAHLLAPALVAQDPTPKAPEPAHAEAAPAAPRGLENAALVTSAENPTTEAKVALGKQLFFDPRLSGSGTMACVNCHLPEHAFTDQKPLSTKDDGKTNTRNSPTMYNVGYLDRLYWDGRARSLEGNVVAAWKAQLGGKPDAVAAKLAAVDGYAKSFQAAFGQAPNEANIGQALAAFLRELRSGNSAYDRFVGGEADALDADQKQGWALFVGKGACITCHMPPLFTDRQFHNVGIGMKAETPDVGAAAKNAFDDPKKTGAFKTPTLRDVSRTGPYFHDGSAATLADAVRVMASGGLDNPHKDPLLMDRKLSEAEIGKLVAFLKALDGKVPFAPPELPK